MKFFHGKGSCSLAVRAALALTGKEFDTEFVDTSNPSADLLRVNPLMKVPALETEGEALLEGAAINLWLDAQHPEAKLMPPLDSLEGARALRWLLFGYATLHPAWHRAFYPARYVTEASAAEGARDIAEAEVFKYFGMIAEQLHKHPGI